MHCNKCGQPLQPWEATTCDLCLRRIQNFPNLQLTQQWSAATLPQTPSKVQGGTKSKEATSGTSSSGSNRNRDFRRPRVFRAMTFCRD